MGESMKHFELEYTKNGKPHYEAFSLLNDATDRFNQIELGVDGVTKVLIRAYVPLNERYDLCRVELVREKQLSTTF